MTLTVTPDDPVAGAPFVAHATGLAVNKTRLTLDGVVIGLIVCDPTGGFDQTLTAPAVTGVHTVAIEQFLAGVWTDIADTADIDVGSAGSGAGADFYIAAIGNDSAVGDITHPFRTVKHLIGRAGPGDTVYLRAQGVFPFDPDFHLTGLAGSSGNELLVTSYPGELAVFDAGENDAHLFYNETGCAYLRWQRFRVQGGRQSNDSNGSSYFAVLDGAHHITFDAIQTVSPADFVALQHHYYFSHTGIHDITIDSPEIDGQGSAVEAIQIYNTNGTVLKVLGGNIRRCGTGIIIWGNSGPSGILIDGTGLFDNDIGFRHHDSGGTTYQNTHGTGNVDAYLIDSATNLTNGGGNTATVP